MPDICQLSIVIINYRSPDLVNDCLQTLLPEIKSLDAKVVVVDNNSDDDSVGIINKWLLANDNLKKVKLVRSQVNTGFSGGNNIGIQVVRAEYYLLLNSDTLIRAGAIKSLLDTAKQHPEAGIVSPLLEWPDGTPQESCFRYLSPFSELIVAANTGPVTWLFKRFDVPLPVSQHIIRPPWTSFACVLIQGCVFHNIGLMDDGYFMYYEDVDFCRRVRNAGWDIVYNPIARVVHLHGGSSAMNDRIQLRKRLPRYYYESRTRYFYKFYGWTGLIAANLLWCLGRFISGVRELIGHKRQHICQKQWIDIWTNFLNPTRPFTRP